MIIKENTKTIPKPTINSPSLNPNNLNPIKDLVKIIVKTMKAKKILLSFKQNIQFLSPTIAYTTTL